MSPVFDPREGLIIVHAEIVELGFLGGKAVVLVGLFRRRYSEVADRAVL